MQASIRNEFKNSPPFYPGEIRGIFKYRVNYGIIKLPLRESFDA